MAATRLNVFHPRLVANRIKECSFPANLRELHEQLDPWRDHLRRGTLDAQGEKKIHGDFLQRVFADVLGYRPFSQATGAGWEIIAEQRVAGTGSADGALGFFDGSTETVLAPIELKGSKQPLDLAGGHARTPVQQGWDYANGTITARWIIVSNYRETRLYAKSLTPSHFETFDLAALEDFEQFKRFWFLLARPNLLPAAPGARSVLDELLADSTKQESEITRQLYAEYRTLRTALVADLEVRHPNIPATERLGYAQTILDRTLFVAFAEDRGLIPRESLKAAIDFQNPYDPKPIWWNLRRIFQWIDKGNKQPPFPAYNGGLFAPNSSIDALEPSDGICKKLGALGSYNFAEDVSVDVLGHIFEQSITDLEALRAEAAGEAAPKVSKRKKEGVFYTPAYITRFIVDETLGRHLAEKFEAAKALHGPDAEGLKPAERSKRWLAVWHDYRSALTTVRVLDPSCGSGAFLLAAYDHLEREYERTKGEIDALRPGELTSGYERRTILQNNLFGVDLNAESVEITKLSLWLRTISHGRQLTYLDRNVKRGNSVVSNSRIDAWAFNWKTGTESLRALGDPHGAEDEAIDARWREGFDVVIGNPPYVRQERLAPIKEHLAGNFQAFHGAADLFVYFFERGLTQLKPGGRLGFIASNSWFRSNFATPLRSMLRTRYSVDRIVDLGDNRVFEDAPDVTPAIVVVRATPPTQHHTANVATFVRGDKVTEFEKYLPGRNQTISMNDQSDAGWHLSGDASKRLWRRLGTSGRPLGEVIGGKINLGIKTGLTSAFVLGQSDRDALTRGDPASEELFRKVFRGEDLRPWHQEDLGRWLIAIPCGWTRKRFDLETSNERFAWDRLVRTHPALAKHLEPFAADARKRTDQGEYWWELRPCAYYDAFGMPKIVWADLQKFPRFSWDVQRSIVSNTAYFATGVSEGYLAYLQSRANWFAVSNLCAPLGERAGSIRRRLFTQYVTKLPIPPMSDEDEVALGELAQEAGNAASARYALQERHRHRMGDLLPAGRTLNEKLSAWWALDFGGLREELKRTFKSDVPLKDRDDWESLWRSRRAECDAHTAAIVACEEEINDRVYGLFGLDAGERRIIEEETKYRFGEV